MLTAAQILAKRDVKIEKVLVPEWAESDAAEHVAQAFVYARSVSGRVRDVWEHSAMTMRVKGKKADVKPDFANIRAKLLVHGICDEQGTLLFTEAQVVALGEKDSAPLDRLFTKICQLSAITEADVEELAGNSETAPSAA